MTQPVAERGGSSTVKASADEQFSPTLTPPVALGQNQRVKGIEPSCPAWEAGVLPLNYTRETSAKINRLLTYCHEATSSQDDVSAPGLVVPWSPIRLSLPADQANTFR